MEVLDRMPFEKKSFIFSKLAKIAEVRKLKPEEKIAYDASLKRYRDTYSVMKTAILTGEHSKAIEIARRMKQKRMDVSDISELSGLAVEEIETL